MGLDMYLTKRDKNDKSEKRKTVCYWRKAFGILNWFNSNLKSVEREDPNAPMCEWDDKPGINCAGRYTVTKRELEELLSTCQDVLESKVNKIGTYIPEDLLPVGKGCFCDAYVGINDWWWYDIERTVKELPKAIKKVDWDNDIVEFYIS